jgi:3-oxoacyl-[acyl-carrier protein] reductase
VSTTGGSQVVAVTGAASGIGLAIARRFALAGARLALGYWRDRGELDAVADAHPDGPDAVQIRELDVRDRAQTAAFVASAEAAFDRVDVLVTCAGVHRCGPSESFEWGEWDDVLAVNLGGTFACIRAALPGMVERRAGRIVTIASELGLAGMAENAAYCASKGGVIALTKALAREYAAEGVLINCVAPGPVVTAMLTAAPEYADGSGLAGLPIGRYGEPDEIARVVEALAGDAGSFFVGQVVSPNGGAVI